MSVRAVFDPPKWFEHLFGFKENLPSVQRLFDYQPSPNGDILISKANNRRFNAGKFDIRSLSSFQIPHEGNGKLHIIRGGGDKKYLYDVLTSQNHPDFNGATFLAASNFNCLEFTSECGSASHGVTNYVYDYTQGPYCALAAGASAVCRNYFVRHGRNYVGQLTHEINLLERTPLRIQHGYPIWSSSKSNKINSFDWSNLDNYLVGVHRGCEVTTARAGKKFTLANEGFITNHVYAAAFNFIGNVPKNTQTLGIAQSLLTAEYKMTILAAYEHSKLFSHLPGAKKCFLTLLGGGVFGNPNTIICKAIDNCKDVILSSGLDVYVVCFSELKFKEVSHLLKTLREETHGSIIETT